MHLATETNTVPSPENDNSRTPERVSVTMLNTRFGEALDDEDTLEQILPLDPDQLALIAFSEVAPGKRDEVVGIIEDRGYRAIVPEGDGKDIDIVWAVSPVPDNGQGLEIRHSVAHRFPKNLVEGRPSRRGKRAAGTLITEAVTPEGRVLRVSSERFAPPILGGRARRRHMVGMAAVLNGLENDDSVDIDLSGGDHNRGKGPTEEDKKVWDEKGYVPVVEDGVETYNLAAASKLTRLVATSFQKVFRRSPGMELDKMYARPGNGRELVPLDPNDNGNNLSPDQIGFTPAETIWVNGTDHAAIRTTVTLPIK